MVADLERLQDLVLRVEDVAQELEFVTDKTELSAKLMDLRVELDGVFHWIDEQDGAQHLPKGKRLKAALQRPHDDS